MTLLRSFALIALLLLESALPASANAQLSDQAPSKLGTAFEYALSNAPFDTVVEKKGGWQKNLGERIDIGFSSTAVWFRTKIYNSTDNSQWFLTLNNTRLDHVEFYLITELGIQIAVEGDKHPQSSSLSALPTFKFTLPQNSAAELLIKVSSDTKLAFYPTIRSSFQFGEYQAYRKHLHFFYIAVLLFFSLTQLALTKAPLSAMNLYYGAGLCFAFLHLFLYYGEGNIMLWPDNVYLKNRVHFVAASLSFFSFTLFLQCYLRTKVSTPSLHKSFNVFAVLCSSLALAMLLPVPNVVMVHIILVESAIISVLAVFGTFRCIQIGNRWAAAWQSQ